MLPSPSTVTRFSGLGRSSVVSQKSRAWRATSASEKCGASLVSLGSSPFIASAFDLPIIWMLPAGQS